jgi:CRP/FNR family cyclic AMP-dependent transcriptional regulator
VRAEVADRAKAPQVVVDGDKCRQVPGDNPHAPRAGTGQEGREQRRIDKQSADARRSCGLDVQRMNVVPRVQLLRNVNLFSACSAKELGRIAALADVVDVEEGRVLTREGHPGGEFFVISDGEASAKVGRKKVATLQAGDFFGEMSLLDRGPRSATVTAETPMRLLVVDPRSFASLVDEVPSVACKIMRALAERLRNSEKAPAQH